MAEAKKFDKGKVRFDLIPPDGLWDLASIFTHGADLYGERNWEQSMDWGRIYAAVQRHLAKAWAGEDLDPESGLPHFAHACWGCMVLDTYFRRGFGRDDRSTLAQKVWKDLKKEIEKALPKVQEVK